MDATSSGPDAAGGGPDSHGESDDVAPPPPSDTDGSAPEAETSESATSAADAESLDSTTDAADGENADSPLDVVTDGAVDAGALVMLSVTVRSFGSSWSVHSSPPGIDCSAPCFQQVLVPEGSTVTLTAQGDGSMPNIGWGPGCSGTSCSLQIEGSRSEIVTLSAYNYVFLTSNLYPGNLGGVEGGDLLCQQSAAAVGLPGTYVAWLATSTVNALDRLGTARGWIRPDGLPFAETVGEIGGTKGIRNGEIFYLPDVDELGHSREINPWTGALEEGSLAGTDSSADCADWTSSDPKMTGMYGLSSCGSVGWTFAVHGLCSAPSPLYCFGVDLSNPLPIPSTPVRHAFLSAGLFLPTSSITTADALCQSEAASAGLANAPRFLALLATTSQSAIARFDLSGLNWARPDGVVLASSPTSFASGALDAALTEHADGTYATDWGYVRTGATATTVVGTGSTCNDWSSSAATDMGYSGSAVDTNFTWFGFQAMPCSEAQPVYCLEQ